MGSVRGPGPSAKNASALKTATTEHVELLYEEYFVEHDVSTADARKAANEFKVDNGKLNYDIHNYVYIIFA